MNLDPDKLVVIFVIAMLVLGPKRLPEAARTVGRWMAEVRKYTSGFQNEFRGLLDEPRRQTSALQDEFLSALAEPRAALQAGAKEAQTAARAAATEIASATETYVAPGPTLEEPAPVIADDLRSTALNAVPDDPNLN